MLCSICHKNPATIHIQEIAGSKKKTLHLCQECAEKKMQEDSSFQALNLAEVLYNISSQFNGEQKEEKNIGNDDEHTGLFCPSCGWDYAGFRKTGRLGCPNCYTVFYDILKSAIGAMHRGTTHTGKFPNEFTGELPAEGAINLSVLKNELEKLQTSLNQAVANEEYERAAILRDKISDLKQQLASGENNENKA